MKTVKLMVLSLTVLAFGACNNPQDNPAKAAQEVNEERTDTNKAEEDAETLVQVTTNGMMEIQSSQKAATMATLPSVKEFANMMVNDHTAMGAQVKAMASQKGYVLPTSLSEDNLEKLADMDKWEKKDWDKKYIEMQIDMHQSALKELENRAQRTKDPAVKAWAQEAHMKVQGHLDRAKQLEESIK